MSCCGERRRQVASAAPRDTDATALAARSAMPAAAGAAAAMPTMPGAVAQRGEVVLRYLGDAAVRVPGPVTGRVYTFTRQQRRQPVAAQDAPALLATQRFHRG